MKIKFRVSPSIAIVAWIACGHMVGVACLAADESAAESRIREILKSSKKATTSTEQIGNCRELLEIVDAAVAGDDFSSASRAATAAVDMASKAGSKHWVFRAKARKDHVQILAKEYRATAKYFKKLASEPDDPEANRKVGLFVSAMAGDWKRGAEMLGKSGNPLLNKVSQGELMVPQDAAEQSVLAAAWKEASATESELLKTRMLNRAYHWIQLGYPAAEGASKKALGDALGELPLRYLSDMEELDVGEGSWSYSKYGITGSSGQAPISIDDIRYDMGLGMHPNTGKPFSVKFKLNGKYKTLQTGCGLNDTSGGLFGNVLHFSVFGDGRLLWKSIPIQSKFDVEFVTVNVKGVQTLELRTECLGNAVHGHAVWLDPYASK